MEKTNFIFLILALLFLGIIHLVLPSQIQNTPKTERLHSPPKHLKHMTFGFNELIADMLWLRFIQDIDHCNSLEWASEVTKARCKKGWGYEMILSIHEVAPKFRIPMAVGPMSLSVLQDDIAGASELFIKAAESFPNDWSILYRAAYHFIYEEVDIDRAADYLKQASENGGPYWLPSLAARLYQKGGRKEVAAQILEDYKESLDDPEAAKKVEERIKALKSSPSP